MCSSDLLNEAGVDSVLSIYKGWQKNGISGGLPISNYKVDSSLGKTKELTALLAGLQGTGFNLYLDNDALRMDPAKSTFMSHSAVKKLNKRIYEEETYKEVYSAYNYLVPSKTAELLENVKKTFTEKNVANIMLSGISNTLFTHVERGTVKDRANTADAYEAIISDYSDNFNLILEQPFSYLWKYTQAMIDMPMEGSNYVFTDEEIPFLAIILKGIMPMYSPYINFEANKEENVLRLVEQGVFPSFYITQEDPSKLAYTNSSEIYTSRFDLYKDDIIAYNEALSALEQQVHGATIVSHERTGDLVTVGYSNGTTVYVNYGKTAAQANGLEIPARSYKVGDGQ